MGDLNKQMAKPGSVATTEAEEKALELRRAGASYRQIAKAQGVSLAMAHKYVKRGMKRLIERCKDEAQQVLTLELDRLDAMLMGLWPTASKGNPQAVEKVLKIMERRAAILGTDAPKKVAPTDPEGNKPWQPGTLSDAELNARIKELAEKVGNE